MSFEIEGKLIKKFDEKQVNDTFKKREFVVETTEAVEDNVYVEKIKFQLVQQKCELLDSFKEGDSVKVSFNIKGRDWENKEKGEVVYFVSLDAWRVSNSDESEQSKPSAPKPEDDDLPF